MYAWFNNSFAHHWARKIYLSACIYECLILPFTNVHSIWHIWWCRTISDSFKNFPALHTPVINEPPHDKTNKMTVRQAKTQIIRPVWSESSLCTQWVAKDQWTTAFHCRLYLMPHAILLALAWGGSFHHAVLLWLVVVVGGHSWVLTLNMPPQARNIYIRGCMWL